MAKGQSLPLYDPPLLVEEKEKENKDTKFLRMQQIGNKKEYMIRFEVWTEKREVEGGGGGGGVGGRELGRVEGRQEPFYSPDMWQLP